MTVSWSDAADHSPSLVLPARKPPGCSHHQEWTTVNPSSREEACA